MLDFMMAYGVEIPRYSVPLVSFQELPFALLLRYGLS